MMDLGKHGFVILASYGVTIGLLAGLVIQSLVRASRVKRDLDQESRDA